jgi:hypothetical protein
MHAMQPPRAHAHGDGLTAQSTRCELPGRDDPVLPFGTARRPQAILAADV